MFIDASALCAMITNEDDVANLSRALTRVDHCVTSPLAIWETVVNVARILAMEHQAAQVLVAEFLDEMAISIIAVQPEMTDLALEAHRRFGRGRHAAALNFGDCFAYACAKHLGMPLLFKGNDFYRTDIEPA